MKSPAVMVRDRLHATRRWIFRWRGLDGTPLRGFLALLITGGLFALFAATVRIRVSAPQQWVEKKASIIHLPADGAGRTWALRAQEGGPYPARFDVGAWEKSAGMEDSLISATRLSIGGYEPKLKELPAREEILPVYLADKDERIFPKHAAKSGPDAPPVASIPVPVLYPRSGITSEELPAILPVFDHAGLKEVAGESAPREFLLELDRSGSVLSCTDLSGGDGVPAIRNWLGKINFGPAVAGKSPTLAVAVGFTNIAVPDGPDPR
ncbi:hypothetical protein OVA24_00325 [Luteolibacter sp. SL250]|uniref:hypothetical protein n=1 Tax=Luteolibacter sp. SL250 TaxID=2995170 RepID=UPI00226F5F91|nr:hypothetical protein [Luteolibacter sp. SL250]WAC19822.1 hypothetical protein OVA24_00325 [Luteolibacter sp. SL250]